VFCGSAEVERSDDARLVIGFGLSKRPVQTLGRKQRPASRPLRKPAQVHAVPVV